MLVEKKRIDGFVEENLGLLRGLIEDVIRIPSPTGSERTKAEFIAEFIRKTTGQAPEIDAAGNVVFAYDPAASGRFVLAAAHIDTVFEGLGRIEPEERDGRLYAPSAGDNSANVAGLCLALKFFSEIGLRPPSGVLFAFTVGEEGIGNLRGMRYLMESRGDAVDEVVAVDGTLASVMNRGVWSKRYAVEVQAEGGHSWHDFGHSSAIAVAAGLIEAIYRLEVPREPRTTYNVGVVKGGTSVNSIAETAEFALDIRSTESGALDELDSSFLRVLDEFRRRYGGVRIDAAVLGERPGGATPENSALSGKVRVARETAGLPVVFHASSTDANIPVSMGIPSVTFGIYRGDGAHTKREYIELDSLETGMKHLLYVLAASEN